MKILCLVVLCCIIGCSSNQNQPSELVDVQPSSTEVKDIQNTRVVFVTKSSGNIAVVNRGNTDYLTIKKEYRDQPRDKAPESSFFYQAPYFHPKEDSTNLKIVSDFEMAVLLKFIKNKCSFYQYAEEISEKEITTKGWPDRNAIVVQQGKKFYIFYRPQAGANEIKKQGYKSIVAQILIVQEYVGFRPILLEMRKSRPKSS
jgi:hypothetical protein